ncbi:helix-turn-helix domain-containing protein [Gulosibacter sp. GYB002]
MRSGWLKRQRELTRLTSVDDQAKLLGVSRASIYRIEGGDAPSPQFMASVCSLYRVGLGEAFEIINDPREEVTA